MGTAKHGWLFTTAFVLLGIMSFIFGIFLGASIKNHIGKQEQTKVVQELSCLKDNSSIAIATEGNCKISCQGKILSVVCKTGD